MLDYWSVPQNKNLEDPSHPVAILRAQKHPCKVQTPFEGPRILREEKRPELHFFTKRMVLEE